MIYLKDGSEIHGMIIEQKPNEYIKIKSGSNIFVYQIDEIDKITKEINENAIGSDIKDKKTSNSILTLSLGLVMFTLGIIGEYVGRIYFEIKGRPRSIIQKILN